MFKALGASPVSQGGLDTVARAVQQARDDGASIVTGGKVANRPDGYHYEPTLITGVRAEHDIMRNESFGPVLPLQAVDNLDEAIALANDSDYGLTSLIYTNDPNSALQASRELKFGETYINREHFEAMQGFHAGRRKSASTGAGCASVVKAHVDTARCSGRTSVPARLPAFAIGGAKRTVALA